MGNFSIPALTEWAKGYSGINNTPVPSDGVFSRTQGDASFIQNF